MLFSHDRLFYNMIILYIVHANKFASPCVVLSAYWHMEKNGCLTHTYSVLILHHLVTLNICTCMAYIVHWLYL